MLGAIPSNAKAINLLMEYGSDGETVIIGKSESIDDP